jgi:hypothetical protein
MTSRRGPKSQWWSRNQPHTNLSFWSSLAGMLMRQDSLIIQAKHKICSRARCDGIQRYSNPKDLFFPNVPNRTMDSLSIGYRHSTLVLLIWTLCHKWIPIPLLCHMSRCKARMDIGGVRFKLLSYPSPHDAQRNPKHALFVNLVTMSFMLSSSRES